ncbi:hypothetical protein OG21DRAFT_1038036 [Imleria badia]|nr:hypothetical protein OG21DRAFT_1038036 [Imleria badia]
MHPSSAGIWASLALAGLANAHTCAYSKAMYGLNGTVPGVVNYNTNDACHPLYNLTYSDFWMHHFDQLDEFPPEPGVFLDIPAGGKFTVELADNRAWTSLTGNPHAVLTDWGDGLNHPDDYSVTNLGGLKPTTSGCIPSPNLHAQNESMAAGTAFAIAYESDISKVTPENLVVFTVLYNTPWKRFATYDVPSGMPPCPPKGCICAFLGIPNGCGQANLYMNPHACNVIVDSTTPKTIAPPQRAQWCEEDESKCVQGPKQMLIWHQADSNNIEVEGNDLSGHPKSPGYNAKCGFKNGAQDDIFVESVTSTAVSSRSAHSKRMKMRHEKSSIF